MVNERNRICCKLREVHLIKIKIMKCVYLSAERSRKRHGVGRGTEDSLTLLEMAANLVQVKVAVQGDGRGNPCHWLAAGC